MMQFIVFLSFALVASALKMPAAVTKLAPRVTPTMPLPQLYVYDHCPFCVRVRLALGLKNVAHNVVWLANDDVAVPTALVGKKIAPIFEWGAGGVKAMPESLDIIALVDKDPRFGPVGMFKPMSGREDLAAWQKKAKETNSLATRPRYMMSPMLPEFAAASAREAFVKNHPIPPVDKAEWKEKLSSEQRWTMYVDSYTASLAALPEINANLAALDALIFSADHCNEGGISLDDIDLWSRLRSLTLVKGLVWPAKLGAYMHNLSARGDVPLMGTMAC